MHIELTQQEIDAVEKWQKYHDELDSAKNFYTYKYSGCELTSNAPVTASHLKDLISGREEEKKYKFFQGYEMKSPFFNLPKWEQMNEDEKKSILDDLSEKIRNSPIPKTEVPKQNDMVHSPNHYADSAIETIDYIRDKLTQEEFTGLCTGNVLKYTSRWRKKGGVQDLEKALVYLQWTIESEKR